MPADLARTIGDDAASTTLVDDSRACLALLRALAEGVPHRPADLARRVLGDAGEADRVDAALDALASAGLPLHRVGGCVQTAAFAVLDAAAIRRGLSRWRVQVAGSTGSTNADAMAAVRADARAVPAVFASELQTAGRGRRGRRWTSAPGVSLTASFAMRVERRLGALDGSTLVCGLAVRDALRGLGVAARLKWPNDVLHDGRKLGGILVEAQAAGDATVVVVGVGLNVASAGPTDGLPATDLACAGARSVDRNALIVALGNALERRLACFARDGFAPCVDEWNAADAFGGADVELRPVGGDPATSRAGVARGVDAGGALLLDDAAGARSRVVSGELSLRPAGVPS